MLRKWLFAVQEGKIVQNYLSYLRYPWSYHPWSCVCDIHQTRIFHTTAKTEQMRKSVWNVLGNEIPVFSAILRHCCPYCCSCIVRDFYLFSPFPTAKSSALCPVFSHRYADSKLWLVYKSSLPGGLSKMVSPKFFGHANIWEALSSLL